MILFPFAKINIGLYVTNKRSDGYHDIETVFFPTGLADILEVIENPQNKAGEVSVHLSGLPLEGPLTSNLVCKAFELVRKEYAIPSVDVFLHKRIPTGAGMGGGSSDGAAMLAALNRLFSLKISRARLHDMALQLGSDCPFFLNPVPSIALGRGEVLKQIGVDLSGLYLYIFLPSGGISTAKAYGHVAIGKPEEPLERMVERPAASWKGRVVNVFESYAIAEIPQIGNIIHSLNEQGAIYVSLTGSGSAVYGLFKEEIGIPTELRSYFIWKELLS